MSSGAVLVSLTGESTLVATIDCPESRNALTSKMVDDLIDVVDEAQRLYVRTLVIRGGTTAFCSGFALGGLDEETDGSLLLRFSRIGVLLERIAECPFMTIAVLQGPAVGAGADLALACDHRLGTQVASFRFPGAAFGVVLGTRRLADLIGNQAALSLIAESGKLDALEASGLGLVDVVAEADLDDRLSALCRSFSSLSGPTVAALKSSAGRVDHGQGLADLVRSIVSRPGLKDRLVDYISSSRRTSPQPATSGKG